jgi:hypothetical protein
MTSPAAQPSGMRRRREPERPGLPLRRHRTAGPGIARGRWLVVTCRTTRGYAARMRKRPACSGQAKQASANLLATLLRFSRSGRTFMRHGVATVIVAVLAAGLAACHQAAASGPPLRAASGTPRPAADASDAPGAASPGCARPVLPAFRTAAVARPGGADIAQPGGGGAITVTATGFSQTGKGMLSIGAEVGNSGTHIAYDTSLVFHAYDSGHVDVLRSRTVTIPVILPGQRVPPGCRRPRCRTSPGGSIRRCAAYG